MAEREIAWPQKKRELVSSYFDSTRWNDFPIRDGDVVIATWGKSGTTWMQQIVAQLLLGPDARFVGDNASPWLDMRVLPGEPMRAMLAAQSHRRFIKTHLPIDALPISPEAKYIFIGRDVRDVVWSLHNHVTSYTDEFVAMLNTPPGLAGQPVVRPDCGVRDYYLRFLETDELEGFSGFSPFWSHTQGWWDARQLPNVRLVHFANLRRDLLGEMRNLAAFLGVAVDEARWAEILEHCSFDYMKTEAAKDEQIKVAFKGGGNTFINKGTNGRWKDVLTPAEIAQADEVAALHLSPECAHWLKTGELLATER